MTRLRSLQIEFDPSTATLHGPQGAQPLRRQVAETLHLLMQRAPALVSVDELLDEVWGRHEISPSAVPQAIRELRRILGDQAQAPTYIETRHKLGYRWLPSVQIAEPIAAPEPAQPNEPERSLGADPPIEPAARTESLHPQWPRSARFLIGSSVLLTALILGWYSRGLWPLMKPVPTEEDSQTQSADFEPNDRMPWSEALAAIQTLNPAVAEQALAELPENELATDLLRARLAAIRADGPTREQSIKAVRAHMASLGQAAKLRTEAVLAHVQGQDTRAWKALAPLLALRPNDLDLHLFAWELRKRMPAETMASLAQRLSNTERLSPPHQKWLAIQIAGANKQPELRQTLAVEWLQQFADSQPGMAAAVRFEQAEALEALGKPAQARTLALAASAEASKLGLYPLALRAMRTAVWNAMVQGQNDVAEADLAAMQGLLQGRDDPLGAIMMRHYRAMLFNRRGDSAQAIDAFTELARDYEALGELGSAASALNATVSPRYQLGRSEEVPDTIAKALDLATRAGDRNTIGFLHGSLGNHYVRVGKIELGQMQITLALEQFREAGDLSAQATALGNLSQIAQMRGRLDEALSFNQQAADVAQALSDGHGLAYANKRRMDIQLALGAFDAARRAGEEAMAGFRTQADWTEVAITAMTLGELALRQADLARAEVLLETIDAISDRGPLVEANTSALRARIAAYRGDFAAAARDAHMASEQWGSAEEQADAVLAEVFALRARAQRESVVTIEEELRQLMQSPVRAESAAIDLNSRLLLVELLLRAGNQTVAVTALSDLDAALRTTPDAEISLRATLLRAETDVDTATRVQRRKWVQAQAQEKGLTLLALEAEGQLLANAVSAEQQRWQTSVRERGALGLLTAQK